MSMSQGQLLALMNGQRGTPMAPMPPPFPGPPMLGVPRPYFPPAYPNGGRGGLAGQLRANAPPLSAPAMSPVFPANPALLSILNGGRT